LRKNKTLIEMIHSLDGLIIADRALLNLICQFNRCKLTKSLVYLKKLVFDIWLLVTSV